MLIVFGSINIDLIARVAHIARPGETVLTNRYETAFGGKGANQAVAAARVSREDIQVWMASAVGDDAFGRSARDNLAAQGVDITLVKQVAQPTGCAFITVDDAGENAITVASGANLAVLASDIGDDLLGNASVLVLQMEVPLTENIALARRARASGVTVVANLAPIPQVPQDEIRTLLQSTDVLVVNEHEAEAVSRLFGGSPEQEHESIARSLATAYGLTCVVTLGGDGVLATEPDGSLQRIAAPPIKVVDTTGAGDTFVGVLAAGIAEGLETGAALVRACQGASLACQSLGAQSAMPDRAALAGMAGIARDSAIS